MPKKKRRRKKVPPSQPPLEVKGDADMIIMTAQEMAEAKRVGLKRELMGADVRCHNGARSLVQRNRKKDNKR